MTKGTDTRNLILATGLNMATRVGLENTSIGNLAKETGMSKSGLFAHFQSKENLQIMILDHAAIQLSETVLLPVLKTESGIPRIRQLVNNWIDWSEKQSGGCIFINAGSEFSDRPGRVRERLKWHQERLTSSLKKLGDSAIKAGDFKPDTDTHQFAFDLYCLLLGFQHYKRLLEDDNITHHYAVALDRLLDNYQT